MYVRASGNVLGRTATVPGSFRTETRDGVSSALALVAPTCMSLLVMNCISCQAAFLCEEALFIQMPNGWTSWQWSGFSGGHGMAQKAVESATFDCAGSSTEGMVPESSGPLATRPCWKSCRQLVTR